MQQTDQKVKLSIADLHSDDPAKVAAARQEFVPLAFVDEQTGTCQRCPGNPPMQLYLRRHPVVADRPWQTRVAEVCSCCHRGSPTGGMWLTKERAMAVLRNSYEWHQYAKEHGL